MKKTWIELATISLLWTALAVALTSEAAATTYAGAIVGIDQAQRTITFQTQDGQTWALALGDATMLQQGQIAKGDRVKVEVDMTGKITRITKLSEPPSAVRTDPIP